MPKFRKRLARRAGQGVEQIGVAVVVGGVVEERAKLRAAQLRGGIGYRLDQGLKVELGRENAAGLVEQLKDAAFIPQFFLGPLARRDVHADACHALRIAVRIEEEFAARLDPGDIRIGFDDAVFDPVIGALVYATLDRLKHPRQVLRMDVALVILESPAEPAGRQTVDCLQPRRPMHFPLLDAPFPVTHLPGFDGHLQAGLGFLQCVFGMLALGDVLEYAAHSQDRAVRRIRAEPPCRDPALAASRMNDPVFGFVYRVVRKGAIDRLPGPFHIVRMQ